MRIARLSALSILAVASAATPALHAAAAQTFPERPIRFITPYAPGGSTSVMARLIGQHLSERWGQSVIVDNRPGGNTVIGTDLLAKAPPDGYTIMLTTSTHSILPMLMKTPYDPIEDFTPVAGVCLSPQVLVVNPGVPANTVQELIALAKSKPGELTFASSGAGGPTHISGEMFNMLAGVKTRHIPYKGGAPSTMAVIGGHVQMFYSVPINVISHVQAGKLKAIAVSGDSRVGAMPQVPTFGEAGLPGFDIVTWNGVTAPAGVPKAVVDKFSTEIGAFLALPDTREKLASLGTEPMIRSADEFAAMIRSEIAMYAKVIKAANLRID